jgi:hypothetical protein
MERNSDTQINFEDIMLSKRSHSQKKIKTKKKSLTKGETLRDSTYMKCPE